MPPSTADHPDNMSVEELDRRAPETVRLEFLDGHLLVKHGPIHIDDFEELARVAPEIPDPVGFTLGTDRLKDFAR
ncbi:hypothetical protein [Streptomyces atratus]|nr:hypothetical protein [Streptomyces atratus]